MDYLAMSAVGALSALLVSESMAHASDRYQTARSAVLSILAMSALVAWQFTERLCIEQDSAGDCLRDVSAPIADRLALFGLTAAVLGLPALLAMSVNAHRPARSQTSDARPLEPGNDSEAAKVSPSPISVRARLAQDLIWAARQVPGLLVVLLAAGLVTTWLLLLPLAYMDRLGLWGVGMAFGSFFLFLWILGAILHWRRARSALNMTQRRR